MKDFQTEIRRLLRLKESPSVDAPLPSGARFLAPNVVLVQGDHEGDARHPYAEDGLTLWAYSSGNIYVQESTFNFFLDTTRGKEPNIACFLGIKEGEHYLPLSITGVAKTYEEGELERFLIYTPEAAFYFLKKEGVLAVLRAFVDSRKKIHFSLYAENQGHEAKETYLASYFEPLLRHMEFEGFEAKWYKSLEEKEGAYLFQTTECFNRTSCVENNLYVKVHHEGEVEFTTGRAVFCGGINESLAVAKPLRDGRFAKDKPYTRFTDSAALGEIAKKSLKPGESFALSYEMSMNDPIGGEDPLQTADEGYGEKERKEEAAKRNALHLSFQGWKAPLEGKEETFSCFLDSALYQNEFVATAKNYAGPYEGTRDVYQQLESFAWIEPEKCRKKLWEGLNFVGDDGRAPRQYSFPPNEQTLPDMDLREYIDQGEWIIEAFYRYLTLTGDFALLQEEAGYYHFEGNRLSFSARRDSVLDHLIAILRFLESNLDEKTGCLHCLYGDWNDAVDGLGYSPRPDRPFGTGVSIMASLGLVRCYQEMAEILSRVGGHEEQAKHYLEQEAALKKSLLRYGVQEGKNGERKILHGWNDGRKQFVGSFEDADGLSRDSLTSNACWVLAGMLEEDPSLEDSILSAYRRLEGKYGLKTFNPGFGPENTMVGRIIRLPIGTAENGATYVHAALFAVWSLFRMGKVQQAYQELAKVLPFTHRFISTSPFVMSNSYMENKQMGIDGESMNDWFSGSVTVIVKALFEEIFGCKANLDTITFRPAKDQPMDSFSVHLVLRNKHVHLAYENHHRGERTYWVNGKAQKEDPSFSFTDLPDHLALKVED